MNQPQGTKRLSLYQQILCDIESQIDRGELLPGDVLPTRSEFAKQYATARATVDKAFTELARRGLIDSGSGKRTVVSGRHSAPSDVTTIGVLWNWTEDQEKQGGDYLDLLFRGIREACAEYMLEVHFRSAPLHTWMEVVQTQGAQGLLVVRPDYADEMIISSMREAGIPAVGVPGILEESKVPSVSADNEQGTFDALDHLYELGHRDIAFVGLTATVPDHFERLQAFLGAAHTKGLSVRPEWVKLAHERNPVRYREHLAEWLNHGNFPTAILSCDFMMTLSVLGRLRELNLSVPRDVSVISFDDPAMAGQMHPAITVVSQPISRRGYRSIERLCEVIAGREVPLVDRLPTRLVVRESTAPPSR